MINVHKCWMSQKLCFHNKLRDLTTYSQSWFFLATLCFYLVCQSKVVVDVENGRNEKKKCTLF